MAFDDPSSGGTKQFVHEAAFATDALEFYRHSFTGPLEEQEAKLFNIFGIPPYPYRSDGISNFYRAVLNEVPKVISDYVPGGPNETFFVPNEAFEAAMKDSRIMSIVKQRVGKAIVNNIVQPIVQSFTDLVNTMKSRFSISRNPYGTEGSGPTYTGT